jgi:hypothetical protein
MGAVFKVNLTRLLHGHPKHNTLLTETISFVNLSMCYW